MGILIIFLTFCAMEFVAWFTHKYIMHGLLWFLHEDHHVKTPGFFEKNDAFFMIFAFPSFLCIFLGSLFKYPIPFWIGLGIACYGFAYFVTHDVIIHQRFKYFTRWNNFYVRAIRKAHKMHHKHLGKEDGECFGMLLVPFKYYKEALRTSKRIKT